MAKILSEGALGMQDVRTEPTVEEEAEDLAPPQDDDELGHFWLDLGDPVG